MRIIVGLGNPGEKYKNTRHNAGFLAVDFLAENLKLNWKKNTKLKIEIAEGDGLILVKPQAYMNNSGQPVRALLDYYKLYDIDNLKNILIIFQDDSDLFINKFKIVENSSSAGHHGIESLINCLGTKNFQRVRLGVRNEELKNVKAGDFVLKNFSQNEKEIIRENILEICKILEMKI